MKPHREIRALVARREDAEAAARHDHHGRAVRPVSGGLVKLQPRLGDIGEAQDRRIFAGLGLRHGLRAGHGEIAGRLPVPEFHHTRRLGVEARTAQKRRARRNGVVFMRGQAPQSGGCGKLEQERTPLEVAISDALISAQCPTLFIRRQHRIGQHAPKAMSLFDQLKRLYRRDKFQMEDFHTEIVAQVLRNSEALTLEWLRSLNATRLEVPLKLTITPQEKFAALEQDQPGSRVDIVIRLVKDGQREMIFIESKIGSTENWKQLEKYAGVIATQEGFGKRTIIYVTRDFEMPKPAVITTRWSNFYQHLKAHVNGDGLASQLKLFMEKNRMSQRNQFTAIDSLALGNFLAAKSLMDDTLWSGVHTEFKQVLGKVSGQREAMKQLREQARYVISVGLGTRDFDCFMGYWLPDDQPTEVAWVGLMLYSDPRSSIRKEVVSAFRNFVSKTGNGWEEDELDDEKAWGTIYKGTGLLPKS